MSQIFEIRYRCILIFEFPFLLELVFFFSNQQFAVTILTHCPADCEECDTIELPPESARMLKQFPGLMGLAGYCLKQRIAWTMDHHGVTSRSGISLN